MKFPNLSMHSSEVMLCVKQRAGRTQGQTHKCPRSNMSLQLLRSWGHNDNARHFTWVQALLNALPT